MEGFSPKLFPCLKGKRLPGLLQKKKEDGSEITPPSVTKEKEVSILDSGTRYGRINSMRELAVLGNESQLAQEMRQCRFLEMAAEQLFSME